MEKLKKKYFKVVNWDWLKIEWECSCMKIVLVEIIRNDVSG